MDNENFLPQVIVASEEKVETIMRRLDLLTRANAVVQKSRGVLVFVGKT